MASKQAAMTNRPSAKCRVAVIWIDWYPYHLARFTGLQSVVGVNEVAGIELVGGIGVHAGMKFREDRGPRSQIVTIRPDSNWHNASKVSLSFGLVRTLTALDPEVVLIPGYYTVPAFAAMLWAKWNRRTSVLMTETTAIDHIRIHWKERVKSWIIRNMFDWAVTGGSAHVRYLEKLGFPADRIAHFYDVVSNDRIREGAETLRERTSAKRLGLPSPYFLFVGRLAEEKDVTGLVKAWLVYREQGGTWSLVLAGDGPKKEAIKAILAQSAHRHSALLMGHKTSRELIPLFAFARCFVLPSTREPWGLVVNEAMAASLPLIVSTRCGCAEDLVSDGDNGMLFDPADQLSLIDCMRRTEALSPDALSQRGLNSAAKIANYTPQHFGHEIARIADWADARRAESSRVTRGGDERWLAVTSNGVVSAGKTLSSKIGAAEPPR